MTPILRRGLQAAPHADHFVLFDPRRVGGPPVPLTQHELAAVQLFNGTRTLPDIHDLLARSGLPLPLDRLTVLARTLDDGLFLDGPTLRAYLTGPVRRPACIGCYPDDPAGIRAQMDGLFTGDGGPGLPDVGRAEPATHRPAHADRSPLRAVLVPHMDYGRGGVTYGWGFKELAERTAARLFVIVATAHYSPARFTLSRMNFATPLGTVPTDQAYIDRIEAHHGPGLFDDPFAHLPEHSIELEVVVLQHLFGGDGFRIVPLLVGSFHDCVESGTDPTDQPDIARLVAALRAAEAAAGEPVCYVISGDLAHIGPKFGDPDPVSQPWLADSRERDEGILQALATADPGAYFRAIAAEGDGRRICGLPPTVVALAAARPRAGRVLHYGRSVDPTGFESVSFAAAAFDG